MSSPRITVVGSANIDLVASCERLPQAGETVGDAVFTRVPGGKGANQAVAAARLGYPVEMVGKVGDDAYGTALLANLSSAGVGIAAMEPVAGASGLAPIFLSESGQNAIVVIPGANAKVDSATIDRHADLIRSAGLVLCQLELPVDTVGYVLDVCAKAGVPVVLDPAPAQQLPESVSRQIAWFTPNETETAFYLGETLNAEEGARHLLARGLQGVVLKRGDQGCYVAVAGPKAAWVPAFKVEAIDTVAAGDCFNGAFAVALLEGLDPWAAARFASAAAAISVTRRGAQASMPSRSEVDDFLINHG